MPDKHNLSAQWARFSSWFHTPIIRGWALLAFAVLAFGIGLSIHGVQVQSDRGYRDNRESRQALVASGQAIAVVACNRNYDTIKSLRGILIAAKANRNTTQSDVFYDAQLQSLKLPDCRDVLMILSDDANAKVTVPKPLFNANAAANAKIQAEADLADKIARKLRAKLRADALTKKRVKERIRKRLQG